MVAFAIPFAALLAYALRGGSYDLIVRQEYGAVVWWVLGVGFACGLLPRARPSRLTLIVIGLLIVYAGWTALSLAWTESSERTTAEIARVVAYVGIFGLITAAIDRTTLRPAVMGLGFAALVVCALAVGSRLVPGAFPRSALYSPSVTNRLSYPFGYWNAVGAWGSMSAAMALAWSIHDESRVRRAISLSLVPVAVLTTYFSYSRGGLAGMIAAVIAVLAISRRRVTALVHTTAAALAAAAVIISVRGAPEIVRGTGSAGRGAVFGALVLTMVGLAGTAVLTTDPRIDRALVARRVTKLVAAVAMLIFVALAVRFGPHVLKNAWNQFRHPVVATSSDPTSRLTQLSGTRYDVWTSAIHAFNRHPINGLGAGSFEFWWDQHATNSEFVRNAHSLELENMAELGVPGLTLIAAIMAGAVTVGAVARRRSRRAATAGAATVALAALLVYLVQASVDWLWQSTAVTVLALAVAAVAAGRVSGPRLRIQWYWRSLGALIAGLAIWIQVPGLLSTAEIRRSQTAERAGNSSLALAWANAAVGAETWSASAYEQRALVLESQDKLGEAARDLNNAVTRQRTDYRPWLLLARVNTERGDLAAGLRDLQQARSLRPRAAVFAVAPLLNTKAAPVASRK